MQTGEVKVNRQTGIHDLVKELREIIVVTRPQSTPHIRIDNSCTHSSRVHAILGV